MRRSLCGSSSNPAKYPAKMAGWEVAIGVKSGIATRIATSCRDCGNASVISCVTATHKSETCAEFDEELLDVIDEGLPHLRLAPRIGGAKEVEEVGGFE